MTERFEMFTVLIARINRLIYRLKAEEMAEYGLRSSHVSCLYYLYREETLTAAQLCDICGEDKANISRALQDLQSRGYLVRSGQGYRNAISLTPSGREVGQSIAQKIARFIERASAGLEEEERAAMYRSLTLVENNLKALCGKSAAQKGDA